MKFNKWALLLAIALVSVPVWAEYTIFMKNGTVYKATEKWEIVDGQARITLTTGSVLTFDPGLIDVARTEQANELGLGDARLIATEKQSTPAAQSRPSLGDQIKLRKQTATTKTGPVSTTDTTTPLISRRIVSTFERAYENVGLFGSAVEPVGARQIRARVTANSEDDVMKAISATSFVMNRIPEIESIQLLMSTLTGGSAGKFEMTRDDAKALSEKHLTWQSYYTQRVIF